MSFESALSGLNAAASDLNVTGNNIANGQTVGFKSSRAEFADIFATSHLGVAQNAIGQGVRMTNVQQNFSQGQFEFTGNVLDMGVAGEGFFRMDNNGDISYSRAGNFQVDKDGFIVNPAGHRLSGYQTNQTGGLTTSVGPLRVDTTAGIPQRTESVTIGANLYAFAGAIDRGDVDFDAEDADTYSFSSTGTVYDSQGRAHMHTVFFTKTGENEWEVRTQLEGHDDIAGPFTLNFDENGALVSGSPINVTYDNSGPLSGTTGLEDVTINFNGMTQFGTTFGVNELRQNGFPAGQFSSLTVEPNGTIFARYTNGETKVLGQVALARFPSPQNLTSVGDNAWVESFTSGEPIMGAPESGQFGKLQAGALEQSNVNISEQLVKMITAQRSYQANAKMISTQDSITQELLNIRR